VRIIVFYRGLLIGWLVSVLASCAMTPVDKPLAPPNIQKNPPTPPAPPSADAAAKPDKKAKKTASNAPAFVSPEQAALFQAGFYKTILAELAGFRGKYPEAAQSFYEAAQLTLDPRLAERAFRVALFAKLPNLTSTAAQLWVSLAPNDSEAQQAMVAASLRKGNPESALQYIEAVLKDNSKMTEPQLNLLLNMLKKGGDQTSAVQVMERLAEQRSKDVGFLYMYARILIGAKQNDKAADVLRKLLNIDPNYAQAMTLYVELLQDLKRGQLAEDFLYDQLREHPEKKEWRKLYANALIFNKKHYDAVDQFKLMLADNPNEYELLHALGLLYLQEKQLADAQEYFQKMLTVATLDEQRNAARFFLGQSEELAKNNDAAIKWYDQVNGGKYYFDAKTRYVAILASQNKLNQALEKIKSIQANGPEDEEIIVRIEGDLYTKQKRYQEAYQVYDRALENDPDNLDFLYLRGMAAERLDRIDWCERDLRRVLALDPDNIEVLNALGYTLADRTQRFEEALTLIQKALDLKPDAPHILDSMGWVLFRLQRFDESVSYLQHSYKLHNDPEIAAHLIEVLWTMRKSEETRQFSNDVRQQFPDNEVLNNLLKRLGI
jgi:tetratricopeptide (TPR) repeat protein